MKKGEDVRLYKVTICQHAKPLTCVFHLLGLELLREAIEKAGYTGKIKIGMDVAASEFYKEGKYDLDFKNKDSNPESWVSVLQLASFVCVCTQMHFLHSFSLQWIRFAKKIKRFFLFY